MSRGSLVIMSSSCQHHHVNNIVGRSSSHVAAMEKSKSSGTTEFKGENTLGRENLVHFFLVKWFGVAEGGWLCGSRVRSGKVVDMTKSAQD